MEASTPENTLKMHHIVLNDCGIVEISCCHEIVKFFHKKCKHFVLETCILVKNNPYIYLKCHAWHFQYAFCINYEIKKSVNLAMHEMLNNSCI